MIFLLEHASHPVGIGGGGTVEVLVLEIMVVGVAPIQFPFMQHVLSTTTPSVS